ncbi:hypothetical protein [Desertivirga xinjiangensis]|uniref:hypothetical protein n=1 Tax=Desertivirga xinjiangensis TaxID=539206 RepID=UPI00210D37FD|nr:hypothetical protein [Pedobacter xinjiangensis]
MGKDRNGTYIPPKGRPTGSPKETAGLRDAFAVNDLDKDNELADKYMDAPDQPAANVYVRHSNRHTNKGEDHSEDN